jgi:hypothetical protein
MRELQTWLQDTSSSEISSSSILPYVRYLTGSICTSMMHRILDYSHRYSVAIPRSLCALLCLAQPPSRCCTLLYPSNDLLIEISSFYLRSVHLRLFRGPICSAGIPPNQRCHNVFKLAVGNSYPSGTGCNPPPQVQRRFDPEAGPGRGIAPSSSRI